MTPFSSDQWVMLGLMVLLGLFLGGFIFGGSKWKRRYREEVRRREALQVEHDKLGRDHREMHSLRGAADRHPVGDRDRGPL